MGPKALFYWLDQAGDYAGRIRQESARAEGAADGKRTPHRAASKGREADIEAAFVTLLHADSPAHSCGR